MHILIIEDQHKTATFLAKGLTEESFVVDIAIILEKSVAPGF